MRSESAYVDAKAWMCGGVRSWSVPRRLTRVERCRCAWGGLSGPGPGIPTRGTRRRQHKSNVDSAQAASCRAQAGSRRGWAKSDN
eukprot:44774-Prymnesium_polylepis.1